MKGERAGGRRLAAALGRFRRPAALSIVLWAAASPARADEAREVRDVRPSSVDVDDKLIVEAEGVRIGAPAKVILRGHFETLGKQRPGAAESVELAGRAVAGNRVLVDVEESLEARFGGHTELTGGQVEVVQELAGAPATWRTRPGYDVQIDFFPRSFRRFATDLARGRIEADLFGWLGLAVANTERGVVVSAVTARFDWSSFLSRYDASPQDGRISRGEAAAGDLAPELFRAIDRNRDGAITRLEAQRYGEGVEARTSFAAADAGLQVGDLVLAADGRPVRNRNELAAAWELDVPEVRLDVQRGSDKLQIVLPRHGAPRSVPEGFLVAGVMVGVALLLLLVVAPITGIVVVWERKVSGRMQSRFGPNRVGPRGWLQWLADALKLIVKEDLCPAEADPVLFKLSPYLMWMGVFATMVVLPASQLAIVADMNIGLLYLTSVTSLTVVGIIMGGWASNSKWSLLGGMRSAAQIISYELPSSVSLLSVCVLAGSLSPQSIVKAQGGWPWQWFVFSNPFTFGCFFIYFISALAEGNRTPFDLPEAESELVSGYNTEYSGFRYSIFSLAEWTNLYVIGAIATTMFLGGWQIPGVSPADIEAGGLGLKILSLAVMLSKVVTLVFVIIWVRWTLPRFRVDQMMNMCWKYFIPLALAAFVGVTGWAWAIARRPALGTLMQVLVFASGGLGLFVFFVARVIYNFRHTKLLYMGRHQLTMPWVERYLSKQG